MNLTFSVNTLYYIALKKKRTMFRHKDSIHTKRKEIEIIPEKAKHWI